MLTVALVSTGHEVLRGHTINTNASWIARRATECGARVTSVRTVGDDLPDLERAIADAAGEASCVVVTGGLGPTQDDRSREALARAMGTSVQHDARAWAIVSRFFERAGRAPAAIQRRQALLPHGAEALDNPEGTAPGILARLAKATVFLLPGPPREMQAMFEREVVPRWRASGALDETASRVVWTAGAPESEIATLLEDLMRAHEPVVGTHPDEGEVAVRLLARGAQATARADAAVAEIARRLTPHVISTSDDVRIEHAVVAALSERRLVLATAESVTGGLVARMLVRVPGASDVFRGGFVVYSDGWKRDRLGVPLALLAAHGAVSEPVARAMAEGALRAGTGADGAADIAVATTGVAGPGPDGRGVAAGTVHVAVATSTATTHKETKIPLTRNAVQRRAAVLALNEVLRRLRE